MAREIVAPTQGFLANTSSTGGVIYFPSASAGLPNPVEEPVSGIPSSCWGPQGAYYYDTDHALVACFSSNEVLVVQASTTSVTDVIDTTGKFDGMGTIAVSPSLDYALGASQNTLAVIKAPFNTSSKITTLSLSGSVDGYQGEAIVFDPAGTAYILTDSAVSVVPWPYTAVSFNMPVKTAGGGAIGITPDGTQVLVTDLFSPSVEIFNAPFSSSSKPTILNVPGAELDGIAVSPDGKNAIVADVMNPAAWAIHAPFSASSSIDALTIPSDAGGFEDVSFSADGKLSMLTGNDGGSEPLIAVEAPFTTSGATVYEIPVNGGRGAGSFRFMPPGLAPGATIQASVPSSASNGSDVTVTLTYGNSGTGGSTTSVISAVIPAGTSFVSASTGGTLSGNAITWNVGAVPAGASGLTVSYVLDVTASAGSTVTVAGESIQFDGGGLVYATSQTIAVSSAPAGFSVRFATDGTPGATLTGTTSQTISSGDNATAVTAVTPVGYLFVDWTGSGFTTTTANPVIVTDVTQALSLTAHFEAVSSVSATSGNDSSTTVGTGFPTPLCVTVQGGDPISGASVTFTVPSSGASATVGSPVTTNESGAACTSASANSVAGTYNVVATVAGITVNFSLTNLAGAPATVSVVSGSGQAASVDGAFSAPLVALVQDVFGNLASGVTVNFSSPTSGPTAAPSSPSETTDASGQASVVLTPGTTAGSFSVTASVPGVSTPATFALTLTPGAASLVDANSSASSQTTTVGTAFAEAFTVVVTDSHQNPVPGVLVAFRIPSSGASVTLQSPSAVTDSNGVASVTGTANTVSGSYTVSASVEEGTQSGLFSLTNTAAAASQVAVGAASDGANESTTVGTAFPNPLSLVIEDSYGNPVPGVTVYFAPTSSGGTSFHALLSASSVITGSDGVAAVNATANDVSGWEQWGVSLDGVPAIFDGFLLTGTPGAPANIVASAGATPQSSTVGGNAFAVPLSVVVTDSFGNVIPGAAVSFTEPASGALAALSSSSAQTDSTGTAFVTANSGSLAGSYSVTAAAGSVSTAFALTNLVGAPMSIAIVTGSGQETSVDGIYGQALTVLVTDSLGNSVPGVLVTYAVQPVNGAGATLSATTAYTNALGQASVTATPTTVAGTFAVSASAQSIALPAVFALTNDPGIPATVTATLATATQSAQVTTAYGQALVVLVQDSHGNPVPGVEVGFAAPTSGASATLSAPSATTGYDGSATITAIANGVAGVYAITASVEGVSLPASFSFTNLSGPPGSIAVTGGGTQLTVVNTAFSAPLAFIVKDAEGNPVSGVAISLDAPASGATALLSTTSVVTAADGTAQVTATSNKVSGSYVVTASAEGVSSSVQLSLSNVPGIAASIVIDTNASDQNAKVGEAFSAPLGVTVLDAFGNPVPGVLVTFGCPASGATCTLDSTSSTTNSSGKVVVHATAGTTPGTTSVSVSAPGVATVTIALTDLVGLPGTITATGRTTQSAGVLNAYAAPLGVVVKDSYGNPVPNCTVSYAIVSTGSQSATLSAQSAVTASDGTASITATANAAKGTFSVSAGAPGVATPAQFSLTNESIQTVLTPDITLPVFGTVIQNSAVTHLHVAVGPNAGTSQATGMVTFRSSRPISVVPGQSGVTQDGGAVVATLSNGAVDVEIQVIGWRSRTLEIDYTPDSAAAATWNPASMTVNLTADVQNQTHGGKGGCSTGSDGAFGLLGSLLLLVERFRRRRR